MRKLVTTIFFLLMIFFAGFVSARIFPQLSSFLHHQNLQSEFQPSSYPLKNQHFVVAVMGQNNEGSIGKTLRSVLTQNYPNYRTVYIDDGSVDDSFLAARDTVYEFQAMDTTSLIQNSTALGEYQNLIQIASDCSDDEILVILNKGSFFSHEWVLQRLNQYYANPNLWMVFANSLQLPNAFSELASPFIDSSSPLSKNQLKSFYVSLFKDCVESYAVESDDASYLESLLDHGKKHAQYVNETLSLIHLSAIQPQDEEK